MRMRERGRVRGVRGCVLCRVEEGRVLVQVGSTAAAGELENGEEEGE